MGFLTKFKMLFNKTINLLPHQRNDVVSFVRFRGGAVKIGSEAIVEENYKLIFVYYNKVCDVLNEGTHKINFDSVPKLYNLSKNYFKKGIMGPKSINADAYFISLKEITHNMFKTQEKVVAYNGDEKVKLRLEGTFSFKVSDPEKFMKALCNDYAIIRNKKTIKEICSTVGFESSKALIGKKFTLDDYIFNKDKICQTLAESVNEHTQTFGVEVSKFFINNLIVNKKCLSDIQLRAVEKREEVVSTSKQPDEDVVKMVEERLNNLQKDLSVVYVNEKGENTFENANNEQSFNPNINVNVEANMGLNEGANKPNSDIFGVQANNAVETEQTIVKPILKKEVSADELYNDLNSQNIDQPAPGILSGDESSTGATPVATAPKPRTKRVVAKQPDVSPLPPEVVVDDELVDELIEKINKRKKQKKNNRIVEILASAGIETEAPNQPEVKTTRTRASTASTAKAPVFTKKCSKCGEPLTADAKFCAKCGCSTEELKVCACCGAKNFANAEVCCVCKSTL